MEAVENKTDLKRIKTIKKMILDKTYSLHTGHLPSCFSCLEILYVLYNKISNITKENASDIGRDKIIISKEHSRLAQVAVCTENGLLDEECIKTYIEDGGKTGHDIYGQVCPNTGIDAIDYGCSSLGHGASVAIGLALGNKNRNVYCIIGDGECQEGSIWEAMAFQGHNKLKNLTFIIDANTLQIDNYTKNIIDTTSNIQNQIREFGFNVIECDGHNLFELENAFKTEVNGAKCIVAHTIKGKEYIGLLQNGVKAPLQYHGQPLTEEDYNYILENIQNEEV